MCEVYSNLKIEYQKEIDSSGMGSYNYLSNTIKIGGCTGLADAEKVALLHELSHTLQCLWNDMEHIYLLEGTNAIFTNEYFGGEQEYREFDSSYYDARKYLYVLCEILGPDAIKAYHFTNDYEKLRASLTNYTGDENKSEYILSTINYLAGFKIKTEEMSKDEMHLRNLLVNIYRS